MNEQTLRRSSRVPVKTKKYEEYNNIRRRKPRKPSKGIQKKINNLQLERNKNKNNSEVARLERELKDCNNTVYTLIKKLGRVNAIMELATGKTKQINGYRTN
jgi:hypothetical protein